MDEPMIEGPFDTVVGLSGSPDFGARGEGFRAPKPGGPVFASWRYPLEQDIAANSLERFPVDQEFFADDGLPVRVRLWVEDGHLCLRVGRWEAGDG